MNGVAIKVLKLRSLASPPVVMGFALPQVPCKWFGLCPLIEASLRKIRNPARSPVTSLAGYGRAKPISQQTAEPKHRGLMTLEASAYEQQTTV